MNDPEGSAEAIVEQISIARRESLPECTPEREGVDAYVRDEAVFVRCEAGVWRDADANGAT